MGWIVPRFFLIFIFLLCFYPFLGANALENLDPQANGAGCGGTTILLFQKMEKARAFPIQALQLSSAGQQFANQRGFETVGDVIDIYPNRWSRLANEWGPLLNEIKLRLISVRDKPDQTAVEDILRSSEYPRSLVVPLLTDHGFTELGQLRRQWNLVERIIKEAPQALADEYKSKLTVFLQGGLALSTENIARLNHEQRLALPVGTLNLKKGVGLKLNAAGISTIDDVVQLSNRDLSAILENNVSDFYGLLFKLEIFDFNLIENN